MTPDPAELAAYLGALPAVALQFDGYTAFTVAAALQLASRHPGVEGSQLDAVIHQAVEAISAGLGEPFAAIITAGWDPGLDVSGAL